MKEIEKVTCKKFYWHLINIDVHNPSSVKDLFSILFLKKPEQMFGLEFSNFKNTNISIQTYSKKLLHSTNGSTTLK